MMVMLDGDMAVSRTREKCFSFFAILIRCDKCCFVASICMSVSSCMEYVRMVSVWQRTVMKVWMMKMRIVRT